MGNDLKGGAAIHHVVDINKDGKDDLVIVNPRIGNQPDIIVCISTGQDFTVTHTTDLGLTNTETQIVDFDGDGQLDLISLGTSGMQLYKGDGTGKFVAASAASLPEPGEAYHFFVLDLNKDQKLDFVFEGHGFINSAVKNSTGYDIKTKTVAGTPYYSQAADYDGDGFPDYISSLSFDDAKVYFFHNDGQARHR